MEQDKTGEYPTPEVPRCYSWSHAKLQGAHTQYKDEGGHPQQSTKKIVQFEMGSKRKYYKNNSIGIMLLCGWVRKHQSGRDHHMARSWIVRARVEKTKQETNEAHSLYGPEHGRDKAKVEELFHCFSVWSLLTSLLMWLYVVHGLGDYKQYHTEPLST